MRNRLMLAKDKFPDMKGLLIGLTFSKKKPRQMKHSSHFPQQSRFWHTSGLPGAENVLKKRVDLVKNAKKKRK